jgi:hypothetical protein
MCGRVRGPSAYAPPRAYGRKGTGMFRCRCMCTCLRMYAHVLVLVHVHMGLCARLRVHRFVFIPLRTHDHSRIHPCAYTPGIYVIGI